MHRTKIDWADYTWNPAWGCRNHCSYCYARATAHRWGQNFEPHWRQKNFDRPMPKEPGARIFVNSMSEIAYWDMAWWAAVMARIRKHPEHRFLFLSQEPSLYFSLDFPENCWLGVTITTQKQAVERAFKAIGNISFASFEPMLEPVDPRWFAVFDWVILGAETGNRTGRVIPPAEWIEPFLDLKVPLYMKDNLRSYWPGPWRREFPVRR